MPCAPGLGCRAARHVPTLQLLVLRCSACSLSCIAKPDAVPLASVACCWWWHVPAGTTKFSSCCCGAHGAVHMHQLTCEECARARMLSLRCVLGLCWWSWGGDRGVQWPQQ